MTVEYYRAALFFTTLLICVLLAVAAYAQERIALDGDTFKLGSERVRIVGIDTPEISDPEQCKDPLDTRMILWQGYAAMGYLQYLLNRQGFEIIRTGQRDQHGRTLAKVLVGKLDVAQAMLKERLAAPYVCDGRCPARKPFCPDRPRS